MFQVNCPNCGEVVDVYISPDDIYSTIVCPDCGHGFNLGQILRRLGF